MEILKNKRLLIGTLILVAIIKVITIRLTIAEDGFNTTDKHTLEIPNIEMGGEVYTRA